MLDFTWPADLAPYRVMFYLQPHVGGSESPLTRTRKTYGLSAPRWVARFTFRAGYDAPDTDGAGGFGPRLDAFLSDLEGGVNRTTLWDWRRPRPLRPQYLSGPLVAAANVAAGATSVPIAGFTPNSIAFSVGDYVGFGDQRPHMVRALSVAGTDGVATVSFKPPLASTIVAGAAISTDNVWGWFQPTSDDAGQNETEVGEPTPYTIDFTEFLP
ncbi:hypothetical protein [Sphingomonas sp. MMS24-J13]|uniref:hypothetical protein n=1 Tax=Sphingomonas sp. MMS24-J13 TaxID=3238686 RepID=UPI003850B5B3